MKQVAMAAVSCVCVSWWGQRVSAARDWRGGALAEGGACAKWSRSRRSSSGSARPRSCPRWRARRCSQGHASRRLRPRGPRRDRRDLSEEDLAEFRAVTFGPSGTTRRNGSPIAYERVRRMRASSRSRSNGFWTSAMGRSGASKCSPDAGRGRWRRGRSGRAPALRVDAADRHGRGGGRHKGRVSLHCGQWFRDWNFRKSVGKGYDLIRGECAQAGVRPPRGADAGFDPIDVGGDAAMGRRSYTKPSSPAGSRSSTTSAAVPGGSKTAPNAPADVRDPFGKEAWEAAGFEVLHFQTNGSHMRGGCRPRVGESGELQRALYGGAEA